SAPERPERPRPGTRTATIRCRDGDHTLELTDREAVAERLLKVSRKHSFDPDVDVDWDVPQDPDVFYSPPQLVSIYETPLWDGLTHRQRVELTKREMCSVASFGIWSELMLMAALVQHSYRRRYDSDHVAYALTEVADECRHSKMFARMVRTCGLRTHRPHPVGYQMGKFFIARYDPMPTFAGALVIEEFTDAFQRLTFPDEDVQPLVRQVSRIHVIEEARHIRFAREELKRLVARAHPARRRVLAYGLAQSMRQMVGQLIHPSCYTA
ncbi:diiron oxygenase, partial [Actinomadura adrarensis]